MSRPPDPAIPPPETAGQTRWTTDRLISIGDIRDLFKLGRTAAYELTHRPEFPEPVPVSPRCYRWWASEVDAFAATLRRKRSQQLCRRYPAGDEAERLASGNAAAPHNREGTRRPHPQGNIVTAPGMPGQTAGRVVVELECGVTVYPARAAGGRWRAVWYEDGARRQCEAASEDRLAAKLEKVTERLAADAPNLERPGADLIAWYLSPDRHPAGQAVVAPSTPTPSGGCASGSSPRSSPRSPARTSRPPTCSRRSTPRPPRAKAPGCAGACPPWSPPGSPAAT